MEVKETKTKSGKKTKTIFILGLLAFSLFITTTQTPLVKADTYSYIITLDCQSYDGYMYRSGAAYYTPHNQSSGGTALATTTSIEVGQKYTGGYYYVYRGYVYFDTSSIPDDATITNATLSLNTTATTPTTNFNLSIQNGQPTYPHIPLTANDYQYTLYSGFWD